MRVRAKREVDLQVRDEFENQNLSPFLSPPPCGFSGLQATAIARRYRGCILMRMARMQVYLPDDLYEQVKARGLPASELLQRAVRAELRRLDLLAETDRYVADLIAEVGPPAAAQRARAGAVARKLSGRSARKVS